MSAYSDWKCGALSDENYAYACWREDAMDKAYFDQLDSDGPGDEDDKDDEEETEDDFDDF